MRPNWPILAYLVVFAASLAATTVLATVEALVDLVGWVADLPSLDYLARWLDSATVFSLGILPWPGLAVLARSIFRPLKPETLHVETSPVGKAVVALIALDEEPAVEQVVRDFSAFAGVDRIIVVDNGSADRTREIALALGARVVREGRRGYGNSCMRALREGLESGYPVVVLCEADCTFRAHDVEKLTAYLRHADLVVGSRTHSVLLSGDSQLNSFFILGNVFVAKLLQFRYWDWTAGGHVRLTDVGCTYLAIRADALERILPSLEVGENHFIPHAVMVALEHGLRVVQVPVTFWKRVGVSKGGNANWGKGFSLGLTMIWHILTYRVRISTEPNCSPLPASLRGQEVKP